MAYRCLVKEDERDAPSFLFESVEPGLHASTIVRPFCFYFYILDVHFLYHHITLVIISDEIELF